MGFEIKKKEKTCKSVEVYKGNKEDVWGDKSGIEKITRRNKKIYR